MFSYLAFDQRSVKILLSEKNKDFFSEEFPAIFMDEHYHSAIDIALENNLNLSVNLMIEYVTVHQNSSVYSNLFLHNLVNLMNQGITLTPLFNSKIFHQPFEFDQWPAVH